MAMNRKNAASSRNQTWRRYTALIDALAESHGVGRRDDPIFENEQIERLVKGLGKRHGEAHYHDLIAAQGLSANTVVKHFRYFPTWDADRRRLLRDGAPLRLMERYAEEGRTGQLVGLELDAGLSVQEQENRLRAHLDGQYPALVQDECGWLSPRGAFQRGVPRLDPVWVYKPDDHTQVGELAPTVARSLIGTYLTQPGVVIDPMAARGTSALEAARLGHRAWASDIAPGADFVAQLDLDTVIPKLDGDEDDDLLGFLGEPGDLLILHPPVSAVLEVGPRDFLHQVRGWLQAAASAVKDGGYLALVLSAQELPSVHARLRRLLIEALALDGKPRRRSDLVAHHLAVAANSSQAWHILVGQSVDRPE